MKAGNFCYNRKFEALVLINPEAHNQKSTKETQTALENEEARTKEAIPKRKKKTSKQNRRANRPKNPQGVKCKGVLSILYHEKMKMKLESKETRERQKSKEAFRVEKQHSYPKKHHIVCHQPFFFMCA